MVLNRQGRRGLLVEFVQQLHGPPEVGNDDRAADDEADVEELE